MEDLVGVVKTVGKVGTSVARAAAGDWVGAVGMWVPELAKSAGDAKAMFDKWKAGQRTPSYVDTSNSPGQGWWGR